MMRGSDVELKMNYKVQDVHEQLLKNREKHIQEYEETYAAYRAQLVAEIKDSLVKAEAGEEIERFAKAIRPRSHKHDYDQAILMLEKTVQDEIVLDSNLFGKFMMDEWSWSEDHRITRSGYFPTGNPK